MRLQYGVILNYFYNAWIHSTFFSILQKIWEPFRRAYDNLAAVKLLRRGNRIQTLYESSLLSRILRFVLDIICRLFSAIAGFAAPAWKGSLIVRLCRGSFILNFEFLLGAFICAMFIMPHSYWNNGYAIVAAIGFLTLYLILVGSGKRKLMYPDKLGFPFMLFAIALVLSLLFSQNRSDSMRILLFFAAAFIFTYVIAADMRDEKQLFKLLAFIYAAVIVTAVYAIIQRKFNLVYADASLTDLTINSGIPGRVTSTLDNPNNYAEFLVLFMPLCAAFAGTRKNQLSCVALLIGLVFPAVALIMTYSRSGWISLMLAALIYVWLRNKKLIPLFIALALLAIPFLPSTIVTRLTTIVTSFLGSSGHIDSSAQYRFQLWESVGYMIRDYGVNGIGLGPASFASLSPLYDTVDGAVHTQSQYFELILETGILGFVSFMWLILRCIKDSVIARRRADGLVRALLIACTAAFVGIAFSCIVEYLWFYPRVLFAYFILLGITFAAIFMANPEAEATL